MSTESRQTRLELQLGSEQLDPIRIEAFEGLSQPFLISLDVISRFGEVDFLKYLGEAAAVESRLDDQHQRWFHGIIIEARALDQMSDRGHAYRLTLAPTAHFHEQGRNFRMFQDKTVLDIVKEVLTGCHIRFETKVSASTPTRTYCVQYGESDFAFVSRLLEEYGLYYFYRHSNSEHVLVICDSKSSHEKLPRADLIYNPSSSYAANADSQRRNLLQTGTYVTEWLEHVSSGGEAKVTLRDYDFMAPAMPRQQVATAEGHHPGDGIEVYGWPGRYYKDPMGKDLSTALLESRRAQRRRFEGTSLYTGIQPGFLFKLTKHPTDRHNRDFLLVAVRTVLTSEAYSSGTDRGETLVQFTAIPDDIQFRAPQVTPRPTAKGPETAVVTGPKGEEIHTDKYGRIKVQFHWDREGKLDDHSSCWVRVSQTGGLGNIILPRVGHEVLVDFINGDPDRPIVVGRVFNEQHMPVYDLPANKTRALWRTKTYKQDGGKPYSDAKSLDTGTPGANELRFEDKTGAEEVFLHAERDMNTRIRYNETHYVGRDATIDIGKNRKETVGSNETIEIIHDRSEKVGGKETVEVTGNRAVTIKSSDKLDVTQKLAITAGQQITLTVGGSSITIGPASIDIKSTAITISATATMTAKGATATLQGSTLAVVKGALVQIN